ncbi:MAG: hypothetical protein JXR51_11265 [Bacteroidales bacterium]|nr:hypothetical protein [Bacteroidales bacterium]MBN2757748.1 hypothetical protein [Bacteroidales bacterium]
MKKLSIILLAISLVAYSCNKDNSTAETELETEAVSFEMTYDGQTYTEAETNSLALVGGNIAVKGLADNGFLLTISGVGEDGTTMNICTDSEVCEHLCTAMLDFGAVVGKEGLVATSGTVKRIGKKIEINISGITTSLVTKTLTATIVVGTVL